MPTHCNPTNTSKVHRQSSQPDCTLNRNATYTKTVDGIQFEGTEWTHARHYADGILRNTSGNATLKISQLDTNADYSLQVYQWNNPHYYYRTYGSARYSRGSTNALTVQGQVGSTSHKNKKTTPSFDQTVTSNAKGEIDLTFGRKTPHGHMSKIKITPATTAVRLHSEPTELAEPQHYSAELYSTPAAQLQQPRFFSPVLKSATQLHSEASENYSAERYSTPAAQLQQPRFFSPVPEPATQMHSEA